MDTNDPCITQDRRPPAMDDLSGTRLEMPPLLLTVLSYGTVRGQSKQKLGRHSCKKLIDGGGQGYCYDLSLSLRSEGRKQSHTYRGLMCVFIVWERY
eukprot:scaffold45252_cov24-Cyclotella_meneghiniana.AAC.4